MELYIIRHGQSSNNALLDSRGRVSDAPLTELGKRQAEIAAHYLATCPNPDPIVNNPDTGQTEPDSRLGYGIQRLYSSPMQRALQTSLPIGRELGITPEVWVDIHERGGIYLDHDDERGTVGYPGKTRAEFLSEFPHYVLPEAITDHGWWNRGFETLDAADVRARRVADQLHAWASDDHADERVAIVSHAKFVDRVLKALLGWPTDDNTFYWHYNTGISRLDFPGDGFVFVRYLNRIDHLPRDLIS